MTDSIIVDTATRIFADLCEPGTVNAAEAGTWPQALWEALEASGLTLTWVPDDARRRRRRDDRRVRGAARRRPLRRAGAARRDIARRLASGAGQDRRAGGADDDRPGLRGRSYRARRRIRCSGRARHVPFARNARHIAVLATQAGDARRSRWSRPMVWRSARAPAWPASRATACRSTARPPSRSARPRHLTTLSLVQLGAAARAQQMAGALEHILDQSVQFSLDRVQFGRPIAKFQAVQHNLANARRRGRRRRRRRRWRRRGDRQPRASPARSPRPRSRSPSCGSARPPATGAAIAHQVHGAMGFTYEHSLHHSTRRLWGWREEFGNETLGPTRLGRMVAARGADALWPFVTQGS